MAPAVVVMLGDVGMGKSTVAEKITGISGLSSNADESFTKASAICESECKGIQIIDTPGGNSMQDKLEHNVWIAYALNYAPVSMILLTVKADTRIDNTIGLVRNYAERFQDAAELLTVCATHMDTVTWKESRFMECLENELGIDSAIFVGKDTTGSTIARNIKRQCKSPQQFTINSTNFLKFFKINNSNLKILKSVNEEIANFRTMKTCFDQYLDSLSEERLRIDLVFEFQAFMSEEIIEAQKRVSKANHFTFTGDFTSVANESGHIANLTNQLRAVLFDVRTMALAYQKDAGISDLRKCPHCGEVWAKLEGCDGTTTCGNRVTETKENRFDKMSRFHFRFDGRKLNIGQGRSHELEIRSSTGDRGRGCGRTICWSRMAPVDVPRDFHVIPTASTDDVELIPKEHKRSFHRAFSSVETSLGPMRKLRK